MDEIKYFIPSRIVFFQVYFFLKFFINVAYLILFFDLRKLNRSSSTEALFYFRITGDIFIIIFLMYGARYIFNTRENSIGKMWYWIIGVKVVMEVFIYYFSVKPAYRRSVYQEFSKWKKGSKQYIKF